MVVERRVRLPIGRRRASLAVVDAGRGDDHVDPALRPRPRGRLDQPLDVELVADVRPNARGCRSALLEGVDGFLDRVAVSSADDHGRTLVRERVGDGPSDPARATGHENCQLIHGWRRERGYRNPSTADVRKSEQG